MTGPEHYREAEACLKAMNGKGKDACAVLLGQAQVHATLALAAATAYDQQAKPKGGAR